MIALRLRGSVGPSSLSRRGQAIVLGAGLAVLVSVGVAAVAVSLAVFTAQTEGVAIFGSKAVFPGEHVTPAFVIGDRSSGSLVDRSSPYAVAADGLTTTTSAWSSAFAANRYLEFDVNDSLASGVGVTSAAFDLTVASSGAGQVCYYFEVRRISTGAVLSTHGSSGSPVGCVTGTTLTSFTTAIASVTTTSIANDLRVRLFGTESASGGMVIDLATVSVATAHQAATLYPVMFRDAADTTVELVPWGLDLP